MAAEPGGAEVAAIERTQLALIGSVIRESRRGRFSAKELSRLSGVSSGLISQIERGVGNPSIATLTRIAYALDLSISSFFEESDTLRTADFALVRREARRRLVLPDHSLEYDLLTPTLHGALGMVRTVIHPGFDNRPQPFVHAGEEIVHVLSGSLSMYIGTGHVLLGPGDSVTYDCAKPHAWSNDGDTPVEVIAAMTPPSF